MHTNSVGSGGGGGILPKHHAKNKAQLYSGMNNSKDSGQVGGGSSKSHTNNKVSKKKVSCYHFRSLYNDLSPIVDILS